MRFLLDTHAFLWFVTGDSRLSSEARALILDPANELLLSVASLWEMAIKSSLGRLRLAFPFPELIERQVRGNAIEPLPVLPSHLDEVTRLPFHHKDPSIGSSSRRPSPRASRWSAAMPRLGRTGSKSSGTSR